MHYIIENDRQPSAMESKQVSRASQYKTQTNFAPLREMLDLLSKASNRGTPKLQESPLDIVIQQQEVPYSAEKVSTLGKEASPVKEIPTENQLLNQNSNVTLGGDLPIGHAHPPGFESPKWAQSNNV